MSKFLTSKELRKILDTILKKEKPLSKPLGLNEQGKPKFILPIVRNDG